MINFELLIDQLTSKKYRPTSSDVIAYIVHHNAISSSLTAFLSSSWTWIASKIRLRKWSIALLSRPSPSPMHYLSRSLIRPRTWTSYEALHVMNLITSHIVSFSSSRRKCQRYRQSTAVTSFVVPDVKKTWYSRTKWRDVIYAGIAFIQGWHFGFSSLNNWSHLKKLGGVNETPTDVLCHHGDFARRRGGGEKVRDFVCVCPSRSVTAFSNSAFCDGAIYWRKDKAKHVCTTTKSFAIQRCVNRF